MDLITIHAQLTATKDALNESLAHEANLQAQLDAAQATHAHVSVLVDGLGIGTPCLPSIVSSPFTFATDTNHTLLSQLLLHGNHYTPSLLFSPATLSC